MTQIPRVIIIHEHTVLFLRTLWSHCGIIILVKAPTFLKTTCHLLILYIIEYLLKKMTKTAASSHRRDVIIMNTKPLQSVSPVKRDAAKTCQPAAKIAKMLKLPVPVFHAVWRWSTPRGRRNEFPVTPRVR